MESNRELPKGMKLVEPIACFCMKTRIKNKKNPNFNQKLFINVCMAADVDPPTHTKQKKGKDSEKGVQWSVPYSAGKMRLDQNKGIFTP